MQRQNYLLSFLRWRRFQWWLFILSVFSVLLAFLPLFNILGYEFSLALALVGSIAGAHLGSGSIASVRNNKVSISPNLHSSNLGMVSLLTKISTANLLLLILPLIIITLNGLRIKNCDYWEGLGFFALMPLCSILLSSIVGSLWAIVIPKSPIATFCSIATVFFFIIWELYQFYAAPPIFSYDPFAGYFPGTLYDENVTIPSALIFYRFYNLIWTGALISLINIFYNSQTQKIRWSRPQLHQKKGIIIAIVLVMGGSVFWGQRSSLGFHQNSASIQARLGGTLRTTHFTIYYPAEIDESEVERLSQDHEFRYSQLSSLTGFNPSHITSYIFRSAEEKQHLMGAGRTFIAKPWRMEIYLQHGEFPHPVLKHELAHVFASLFGDKWFGVSLRWEMTPLPHPVFNVGLIEGFAVAADWHPYGEMDGHQMAAALIRLKLAPPLQSLLGHGFLAEAASRSYILAGSFCRFLLERYGVKKLEAVYSSGGDFQAAYGKALKKLIEDWFHWLNAVVIPPKQLQLAQAHFIRPSIWRRVCSHEVANLLNEAMVMQSQGKTDMAATLFERTCRFDPGDPEHYWRWMRASDAAGKTSNALAIGKQLLQHPAINQPLRRQVLEFIGDINWRSGKIDLASQLFKQAASLPGYPSERRALLLRQWALTQSEEIRHILQQYLNPPFNTSSSNGALAVFLAYRLKELVPQSGLGSFLIGKQLIGRDHFIEALHPLQQALQLPLPSQDFVVEASRLLGQAQTLSHQYFAAAQSFKKLQEMPTLPAGIKLETSDWMERIQWMRTQHQVLQQSPRR